MGEGLRCWMDGEEGGREGVGYGRLKGESEGREGIVC